MDSNSNHVIIVSLCHSGIPGFLLLESKGCETFAKGLFCPFENLVLMYGLKDGR